MQQSLFFIPTGPGLAGKQNYTLHLTLLPTALWLPQPQARRARRPPFYPTQTTPLRELHHLSHPQVFASSPTPEPRGALRGLRRSHPRRAGRLPPQQNRVCAMCTEAPLHRHDGLGRDLFYANKPLLAVRSQGGVG